MTRRQVNKLGRIIAQLEALQSELNSHDVETINYSKSGLMRLWAKAEEALDAKKR